MGRDKILRAYKYRFIPLKNRKNILQKCLGV